MLLANVAALIAIDPTTVTEEVTIKGYATDFDGGEGLFYWSAGSALAANGGTVIASTYPGANGTWVRVNAGTEINVRWFGAKGDGAHDDTQAIQAALDFIKIWSSANVINYNLYIPAGFYVLGEPASGADSCLSIELGTFARFNIYGDGSEKSILSYSPGSTSTVDVDILRITGDRNPTMFIKDFSIRKQSGGNGYCTGLNLQTLTQLHVENLTISRMRTGLNLDNVLISEFQSMSIAETQYGLKGQASAAFPASAQTPPNLLSFKNCYFYANTVTAVTLEHGHSVSFDSCDISYNGGANTPSLTAVAGIDYSFFGHNGANGLNVTNCYLESNFGLADIRVTNAYSGTIKYFGTHTFRGNTFNRNANKYDPANADGNSSNDNYPAYTKHNILVVGAGQDPKQKFGQSKSKLIFDGNGFFTNMPGFSNDYQPSSSRRAIEIQYFTDTLGNKHYWEFDVVEQGNAYPGLIDAPVFDSRTPQTSELTRVKAKAYVNIGSSPTYTMTVNNSYNIEIDSCTRVSTGIYEIYLANPLTNTPTILLSCNELVANKILSFAYVSGSNLIKVYAKTVAGTLAPADCHFSLLIM